MKAIILAAGQGTRLKKYTQNLPKGMLIFAGKTLIERQIEAYREAGIKKIIIVRGFAAEKIAYDGVTYYTNEDYAETNMVESLLASREEFDDDVIVSYSDIVFEKRLLEGMMAESADFAVAVDDAWQKYWKKRYGTVDFDTESLSIGSDGAILELGKENPSLEEIDARYIGILKFSQKGLRYIVELIDKAKVQMGDKPWQQSGKPIRQAYMTDLINAVIKSGKKVRAVRFRHGWLEFDTNEDYEMAMMWKEDATMGALIQMEDDNMIKDIKNFGSNLVHWIKNKAANLSIILDLTKIPMMATVSSVPVNTTGIDAAFLVGAWVLHRLEADNTVTMLKEYVDRKIDSRLDPDNLAMRELVNHVILKSSKCSKKSQIKRIMDIFQEALEGNISSFEEAEDLINTIAELSENEAILLAKIYKYFEHNSSISNLNGYTKVIFENLPERSWGYLLNRLEGKGLLNSEPNTVIGEDIEQMFDGDGNAVNMGKGSDVGHNETMLIFNSKTYLPNEFGKQLFQSLKKCHC